MRDTPSPVYDLLATLHASCPVCGAAGQSELGLKLHAVARGEAVGTWCPEPRWSGYNGRLQGGIAVALLDAAMTHALFAAGVTAVTAALEVRFPHAVREDQPLHLHAIRKSGRRPLHRVEATLEQNGTTCVHATARFLETPEVRITAARRARHVFHRPPHDFNCAQSVMEGARAWHDVSDDQITAAKSLGRGGGPDGICGALAAAEKFLSPAASANLRTRYVALAGSIHCEEIRTANRLTCLECVTLAASALDHAARER